MQDAMEPGANRAGERGEAEAPDFQLDQEDDMFEDHRDAAGGFVVGLLLGAALGAVAALLLAPASGEVTRRRLHRRLADLRGDAQERFDALRRRARRRLAELKD